MAAIETVPTADPERLASFDQVIDVRAPVEFAEDHIPGAVNLPVLSDAQRAEVGTLYVQGARFEARRIGAAHVARNVADHLTGPLAGQGGGFRPLLYCWRGGMRSHAMATILAEVGWRVGLLQGGYKTYRSRVCARLYDQPLGLSLVLLEGPTGSGKTEILARAAALGAQVLDIEALAAHRGSLLGALPDRPQPPQKLFESRLLTVLEGFDPTRPVLVEAESSKVGQIMLPTALWNAMKDAPRIAIEADPTARAAYLLRAYRETPQDPERFDALLARLPPRLGKARIEAWRALARAGAFGELAEALLDHHYDPAYAQSRRNAEAPVDTVTLPSLDAQDLDAAGAAVAARLLDIG